MTLTTRRGLLAASARAGASLPLASVVRAQTAASSDAYGFE